MPFSGFWHQRWQSGTVDFLVRRHREDRRLPGRDPGALFHVRRKHEALAQDIMKRPEDLVAGNFWKILQVHEVLMERRRINGEDIAGIIELMPDGPVTQEDAA